MLGISWVKPRILEQGADSARAGPLGRRERRRELQLGRRRFHRLAGTLIAAHHGSDGSLPLPVPAPAAVELDAISAMNPQAQLKISTDPA